MVLGCGGLGEERKLGQEASLGTIKCPPEREQGRPQSHSNVAEPWDGEPGVRWGSVRGDAGILHLSSGDSRAMPSRGGARSRNEAGDRGKRAVGGLGGFRRRDGMH